MRFSKLVAAPDRMRAGFYHDPARISFMVDRLIEEISMVNNGWIIDNDYLTDPVKGEQSNRHGAAGTIGPRGFAYCSCPDNCIYRFRMLDDDREVYYEGRSTEPDTFDPLDHFGKPNAGCTIIQFMNQQGEWYDL